MKKIITLIILLVCLTGVQVSAATAIAAEKLSVTYTDGTRTDLSFMGYLASFDPELFSCSNPSSACDNRLASLSGIFSWAEYNDADKPPMKSVLNAIGIPDEDIYEYQQANSETHYAYTIAKKKIYVDGKDANLLIISARGTQTGEEARSDHFTRPDTNFFGYNAYGFVSKFEMEVMNGLNGYLDKHPELMEMPLKVLFTGHSLGGAVANLLGARFTMFSESGSWWAPLLTKDDIYVYTFASIDSIKTDSETVSSGFENIHNIYNYHDSFGPHGWPIFTAAGNSGHGKFGHIDLFYTNVDQGAFGANQNHMMNVYLDAVRDGKVLYGASKTSVG